MSFVNNTGKDGSNLVHNLIEPRQIQGYNIVKDNEYKWQRKRYQRIEGTANKFETVWEDDPNSTDVNEFLVWYDVASFIQKPYQPDTRFGGLLYKVDAQKYVPTLSQRSPSNTIN